MLRKRVLILTILLVAVSSISVRAGIDDCYPDGSMLLLSTSVAQLGELKVDPLNPQFEYFEVTNGLTVLFYPRSSRWQVVMSGSDFRSGVESIPLEQLEWKKDGEKYKKMPSSGRDVVLAKSQQDKADEADQEGRNIPRLHYFDLSFRLVLKGVEVPGRYGNTMIISMVFP